MLAAHDDGAEPDQLALLLMAHFGVDDVVALSYAFTTRPQLTVWGALAPLVFAAADAGSALAASVVDDAAKELAAGVGLVHARGAAGTDVVCAGGVVTNQPRLYRALTRHIDDLGLGLAVHLLHVPPVIGAVALARKLPTHAPTTESWRNS